MAGRPTSTPVNTHAFYCPYCDFTGTRMDVHAHLVQNHGDQLGWRVNEKFGYTYCVITCPICGASHDQIIPRAQHNPAFLEAYKEQIYMVAFDLLLYHLQGEHGMGGPLGSE